MNASHNLKPGEALRSAFNISGPSGRGNAATEVFLESEEIGVKDCIAYMGLSNRASKTFKPGEEKLADIIARIHTYLVANGVRTVNANVNPSNQLTVNFSYAQFRRLDEAIERMINPIHKLTPERVYSFFTDAINQRAKINTLVSEVLNDNDKKYLKEQELFSIIKTIMPKDSLKNMNAENFRSIIPESQVNDIETNILAYKTMARFGFYSEEFKEKYTQIIGKKHDKLMKIFGTYTTDFAVKNINIIPKGESEYMPNRNSLNDETYALDLEPMLSLAQKDVFFVYDHQFCFDEHKKDELLEDIAQNICKPAGSEYSQVKDQYYQGMLLAINTTGTSRTINPLKELEKKIRNKTIEKEECEKLISESQFYFELVSKSYDALATLDPDNKETINWLRDIVSAAYCAKKEQITKLLSQE